MFHRISTGFRPEDLLWPWDDKSQISWPFRLRRHDRATAAPLFRAAFSMLTINRLLLVAAPCTWALASTVPVLAVTFANLGFAFIVILVSYWSLWHFRQLFFNGLVNHKGKAVLITGCDTGFGHLLADRLAEEGFLVFAGCLEAAGAGAKILRERTNIRVLQMDVTKEEDILAAVEIVEKALDNKVLWGVVCNAGVGSIGYIDLQPLSRVREVVEVNTFGVLAVACAFLPLLKKSRGRLVIVSSLLARLSVPECLAYCISKRASITLADGLRQQFYSKGVHVCTVEPAAYRTSVADHAVLEKAMDADLQRLPERIRYTLDERFVERLKSRTRVLLSWFIRNDTAEAVDVMRRATLDRMPKAHYTAGGTVDHVYRLLIDLLPAEVMDEALHIMSKVATLRANRTQK
ncbi:retinol dehydrogenase 7 isoform X1 [Dermacentor silvarum]|uniref:retinol dehydrogenase 7 isoform X1 n=1 Tax=Dermacentor silvarum TaxID=543639 RepID=UPI0021011DB9|nr:retinol dehydrogenase 7 isoform X1 [Dermacentor silvarum]